jgi:L-histidine N-alpha-methyltransferase
VRLRSAGRPAPHGTGLRTGGRTIPSPEETIHDDLERSRDRRRYGFDVTADLVAVDDQAAFWEDGTALRAALLEPVPRIPPVYGYDERGSELFEQITRLPTYYLTRVEWELLRANARAIADRLHGARFVELGSGSGKKTRELLAAGGPRRPAAYLPVDVSREMLELSTEAAQAALPGLPVLPLWGRYEAALGWLRAHPAQERLVIGFLGSNLGNMTGAERDRLLGEVAATMRPGDGFLVSADLRKPADALVTCYNDPDGHTAFAEFRLNHLTHLNHRCGADFVVERYLPRAHCDAGGSEVVGLLHVVEAHEVEVAAVDVRLALEPGDAVNVGISAKFEPVELAAELARHGLDVTESWTDARWRYGLFLAVRR